VERTRATIQPKPQETLTNAEILRLGYLTGVDNDTETLEDRRQALGLRPADGKRPDWLANTGKAAQAEISGLGENT
jgi:hypothetical protein